MTIRKVAGTGRFRALVAMALGGIGLCAVTNAANVATTTPVGELATPVSLMQLANPADASRETPSTQETPGAGESMFNPITVRAKGAIAEEDLVGSYSQPRWTADRRFAGTRTYVIPDGAFEVEYWLKPMIPRNGSTSIEQKFEVEMGLPHRFQLDLYLNLEREGAGSDTNVGSSIEGRYALADWGKIWGNPAVYVEYTFGAGGGEDAIEGKLLLTDELAPRWHWSVNLSFEYSLGHQHTAQYEFTGGISYTVLDRVLSVGLETESSFTDSHTSRSTYEHDIKFGPSIQYRPRPNVHVDFVPLFGVTGGSSLLKIYLVVGYEF